jgi:hypothetical protein
MHAFYYEWDWPKAEAEFKQAIELDPNNRMLCTGTFSWPWVDGSRALPK